MGTAEKCFGCGALGHRRSDCPRQAECFNCGELGHRRADCPKKGATRTLLQAEFSPEEQEVVLALARLYRGSGIHGYGIPEAEKTAVKAAGGSHIYGELEPPGALKLVRALGLTADDVFFDLGCGVGKVLLSVALASDVRSAVGLELSATRVRGTSEAFRRAEAEAGLGRGRCSVYAEDFLDAERLTEATVCYCCNLTLPDCTFAALLERFILMPRLRLVATLKNPYTESSPETSDRFQAAFKGAGGMLLPTSWSPDVKVYLFRRR